MICDLKIVGGMRHDGGGGEPCTAAVAVNMLTGKVADHLGFSDRGRVRPGLRATAH